MVNYGLLKWKYQTKINKQQFLNIFFFSIDYVIYWVILPRALELLEKSIFCLDFMDLREAYADHVLKKFWVLTFWLIYDY